MRFGLFALVALLAASLSACTGAQVSPAYPRIGSDPGRSSVVGQPIKLTASWEAYCKAPLVERLTGNGRGPMYGSGCHEVEFVFAGKCSARCEWSLRRNDGTFEPFVEGTPITSRGAIFHVLPLVPGPLSVHATLRRLDTGEEASLDENGFEISSAPATTP